MGDIVLVFIRENTISDLVNVGISSFVMIVSKKQDYKKN